MPLRTSFLSICLAVKLQVLEPRNWFLWNFVLEKMQVFWNVTSSSFLQFIHFVVYLTTGPQPFSKWLLRSVRYSASCTNFQYSVLTLMSPSKCLRLLPRLPIPSILPSIFPSITCLRRQLLSKMWPIQLVLLLFTLRAVFLSSLILCNIYFFFFYTIGPPDLLRPSPAPYFKTLHHTDW